MKKILTTIALGASLFSTLNADLARVEMGAGMWNQTPDGYMSHTKSGTATGKYTSDKKEDSSAYIWMLIKHPIPIVPNIRLEYASIKDTGIVSGEFKDFVVPGASTTGSIEITEYDIIPYYNILDNTFWTTIDLGIDLKVMETKYTADGVNLVGTPLGVENYSDSSTAVIPLVYARLRVEIPVTNIGLEADVKYISYEDSTISDIRVKVDYTLAFIPVIQPAIEVGYRVQKFDVTYEDGADKTRMDMEFSGVYAGMMLRF